MDPRLLLPDTWTEPLAKLRAALPENAISSHFSGTLAKSSYGGSQQYRTATGEVFHDRSRDGRYTAMSLLRELAEFAPSTSVGLTIDVDRQAPPRVALYELPGAEIVSTGGHGAPIAAVVLRADALPAPYRRLPERYQRPWDASMDPDWLAGVVRRALPQAIGLTDEQLQTWEQRSRCILPPDIRALYRTAASGDLVAKPSDAPDDDEEAGHVMRILPLGEPDPYWRPEARFGGWEFGATEAIGIDPAGRVQPLGFSPAWVPIGDDWGGNYFVADLAPGPNGTIGQILFVDHETNGGASWVAPSLTSFVANPPASYDRLPAAGPLKVRIGNHTDQTLADVTPETEVLIVNRVDEPVDLTTLAGHPRLRTLEINPGPVTGIEVVAQLPALEYLATDLATWRRLIDRQLVPDRLFAAGFEDDQATWADNVPVANQLLARWGRPHITERVIV